MLNIQVGPFFKSLFKPDHHDILFIFQRSLNVLGIKAICHQVDLVIIIHVGPGGSIQFAYKNIGEVRWIIIFQRIITDFFIVDPDTVHF